jgi:hypothetical protein
MPRDVFCHLEHGHLLLASKNSFEHIVSVSQHFVLRILQFVLPDIIPELLDYFATRERLRSYNFGQRIIRLNGVSSKLRLVCGHFWMLA